jgi:hypothetical protein
MKTLITGRKAWQLTIFKTKARYGGLRACSFLAMKFGLQSAAQGLQFTNLRLQRLLVLVTTRFLKNNTVKVSL